MEMGTGRRSGAPAARPSSRTCVAAVHVDPRPVVLASAAHHVVLEIRLGHV